MARPADPAHLVEGARRAMRRQAALVCAIFAVLIWADQTAKAWAWRHSGDVRINSGGDSISGAQWSDWLRAPASGAAFDVVDAVALVCLALLLARVRRPLSVLVTGSLALAGWSSNVLDRLGMHYVTAPDSVRGAVDFVPWSGYYWNLADAAIVVGTVGFVLALLVAGIRARPHRRPVVRLTRRPLAYRWAPALICSGVVMAVVFATFGATHYGTLAGPI